jgi:hypothetical protein
VTKLGAETEVEDEDEVDEDEDEVDEDEDEVDEDEDEVDEVFWPVFEE